MASELMALGILFFFAIVGAVIAKRVKQPTVIGLILVGAIIGPNMLGWVSNQGWIDMLIDLGTMLLLFVVGLEFTPAKLMKLGFKAFVIATIKVGIAFTFGFYIATLMGFSTLVGMFTGVILSFSSTVVIVRILEEKGLYDRKETPLLLTILIIEDILAVMALIFFAAIRTSSEVQLLAIGKQVLVGLAALLVVYYICLRLAKSIFKWFIAQSSGDITALLGLGFCAGFSVLATAVGLSSAAGAFLAGSVVASLPQAKTFEKAISPYVLLFSALFFISVGTLVDFSAILPNWKFIVLLLAGVLISRFLAIGTMSNIFGGFKEDQAFFSSLVMLSVGPFALLVARESAGMNLGVDLITVTSVLMFVSAVGMSVCVAQTDRLYSYWRKAKRPAYVNHSVHQLAWYFRGFFDQLDIENSATRKFKQALSKSVFSVMVLIFLFVGWGKGIDLMNVWGVTGVGFYVVQLLCISGVGFALYVLYNRLRNTQRTFVRILAHIDTHRNLRKAKRVYKNLMMIILSLVVALFFPIGIFAFELPLAAGWFSLGFLVVCGFYFSAVMKLLNSYNSVNYEKTDAYRGMTLRDMVRLAREKY